MAIGINLICQVDFPVGNKEKLKENHVADFDGF
jgi:hypothetical protein